MKDQSCDRLGLLEVVGILGEVPSWGRRLEEASHTCCIEQVDGRSRLPGVGGRMDRRGPFGVCLATTVVC